MGIKAVKSAIIEDKLRRYKAEKGDTKGFDKSHFKARFTDLNEYIHQHSTI